MATCMFVLTMAFSLLPMVVRGSDRLLHYFIALACGIFLGVVFLHLLPEVGELAHDNEGLWNYVLAGVVGIYLIESLFVRTPHDHGDLNLHEEQDQHHRISWAAFVGLAIHSVAEGMGMAAIFTGGVAVPLLVSVVSHHGPAGFSLCTIFRLAGFSLLRIVLLLAVFAALTPASIVLGRYWISGIAVEGKGVLMALAAGTFLFVALCELLPEIFHRPGDRGRKVVVLLCGILLMVLMHGLVETGHAHE